MAAGGVLRRALDRLPRVGGGRALAQLDQLHLYHQAFSHVTGHQTGERIEVELHLAPGDEIATAHVRVPPSALTRVSRGAAVVEVSTSRGGQDRPVEITALAVEQGAVSLAGRRGATHTAICSPEVHEELLEFSFRAWEVITPAQGAAPYVYATADLHLRFPSMTGVPVLLTIITPEDVSPRSTQGNYALAYPSRLLNGQRQTNIYFPSADAVRLAYRCGESGQFSGNPWVSIGRSAFNSVFVFFVGVLAASVDRGDRFGALIVTFLAVAGALWEIVQETSRFTIYDKTRRYIHGLVLGAQLSTLAVLSASVISISLTDSGRLLHFSSYLALAVAGVLGVTSCIGFFLHYQGFWQGFQCDHAGCARVFRIRRDRPECRYTGRVFCDEHVRTVCRGCAHESDLLGGTVTSIGDYHPERLRCRDVPPAPQAPALLPVGGPGRP